MDRVQSLPQFINWLKDRAKKNKQDQCQSPPLHATTPKHSSKCKCRSCMKLPQLPREQRRQQKIVSQRGLDHDSPEHVYEEIHPDLVHAPPTEGHVEEKHAPVEHMRTVLSPEEKLHPDSQRPHRNTIARVDVHTVDSMTGGPQRQAQPGRSCHRTDNERPLDHQKKSPSDMLYQNDAHTPFGSEHGEMSKIKCEDQQKSQGVNLGNLDFGQAKEFGGFLVVPMRDKRLMQLLDETQQDIKEDKLESANKPPQVVYDSVPQHKPKDKLQMLREVLAEHMKEQDIPSRHVTNESAEGNCISSQCTNDHVDEPQDHMIGPERKSAFTKYIKTCDKPQIYSLSRGFDSKSAFKLVTSYENKRSSMCTESSGDSGGYFSHDVTMASSQKSSNQSMGSDRSNDTYSEYDMKSDNSSKSVEYDLSLQKVQQVRFFEEHVQQILRESESETEYSSSSSDNQTVISNKSMSPMSMLDIDEILNLVSSDDNDQLINDLIYDNEQNIHHTLLHAKLRHNVTKSSSDHHNANSSTHDKHKHRLQRRNDDSERLSCRATNYTPPFIPNSKYISKKSVAVRSPPVTNRLLSDLMRQNHDRQLFI